MNGNCFCGSIHYKLLSKSEEIYYCHCLDCQILSGGAFQVLGVLPRNSISLLTGEPSEYSHPTASGSRMTREFCPTCGTPMFLKSSQFPKIQMFTISTLQQDKAIVPTFEIWTASKQYWSEISEEIESFRHGTHDAEA